MKFSFELISCWEEISEHLREDTNSDSHCTYNSLVLSQQHFRPVCFHLVLGCHIKKWFNKRSIHINCWLFCQTLVQISKCTKHVYVQSVLLHSFHCRYNSVVKPYNERSPSAFIMSRCHVQLLMTQRQLSIIHSHCFVCVVCVHSAERQSVSALCRYCKS